MTRWIAQWGIKAILKSWPTWGAPVAVDASRASLDAAPWKEENHLSWA